VSAGSLWLRQEAAGAHITCLKRQTPLDVFAQSTPPSGKHHQLQSLQRQPFLFIRPPPKSTRTAGLFILGLECGARRCRLRRHAAPWRGSTEDQSQTQGPAQGDSQDSQSCRTVRRLHNHFTWCSRETCATISIREIIPATSCGIPCTWLTLHSPTGWAPPGTFTISATRTGVFTQSHPSALLIVLSELE